MAKLDFPGFEMYLSAFDFPRLFANVLGWNHASSEATWANDAAGETPFSRRTVAELGGVVAIQVVIDGGWPDEQQRMDAQHFDRKNTSMTQMAVHKSLPPRTPLIRLTCWIWTMCCCVSVARRGQSFPGPAVAPRCRHGARTLCLGGYQPKLAAIRIAEQIPANFGQLGKLNSFKKFGHSLTKVC